MHFQEALYKQYEALFSSYAKKGAAIDVNDLEFRFTRNLPVNENEEIDAAIKLAQITSKKTVLSRLSFIQDPETELKQIDLEASYSEPPKPKEADEKPEENVE